MPNAPTSRKRRRPPALLIFASVLSTCAGRTASASTLLLAPDCTADPGTFGCHLLSLLNFLYAAAAVLAVVLIVVIVIAVKSYRKNSRSDERRSR